MIHKTAIIHSKAEIDASVEVGPYAIIAENVSIGPNSIIGAHAMIEPFVTLEADCHIFPYACIGSIPQALKFENEKTYVKIGQGTVIREFATVHRGTESGGGITEVGEKNFIMAYSHVAHDCRIGREVVMSNNATLAGHITVGNYATIGGLVAIHQFVRIGDYAFIGGKSAVVKDIPPFVMAAGDRATLHGLNNVGLKRRGFSSQTISELKKAYRIIFRIGLTLNEAIERVTAEVEPLTEVKTLIGFLKTSERGITR